MVHNSVRRWDGKILSSVFVVVFYSAHSKTETKNSVTHLLLLLLLLLFLLLLLLWAGRKIGSITRVICGIEKFSFRIFFRRHNQTKTKLLATNSFAAENYLLT